MHFHFNDQTKIKHINRIKNDYYINNLIETLTVGQQTTDFTQYMSIETSTLINDRITSLSNCTTSTGRLSLG